MVHQGGNAAVGVDFQEPGFLLLAVGQRDGLHLIRDRQLCTHIGLRASESVRVYNATLQYAVISSWDEMTGCFAA